MKLHFLLLVFLVAVSSMAIAQDKPSPEAEALFTKMMSQINPRHVQWVQRTAKETNDLKLDSIAVMRKVKEYGALGKMNDQDIMSIAFLVMMQAAKSAQNDLKSIMDGVKAINKKKEELRTAKTTLEDRNKTVSRVQIDSIRRLTNMSKRSSTANQAFGANNRSVTRSEIEEVASKVKKDLDSISEMGEMESLKLQMAMDRMSKMMSMLSNILKKIKSTQDSIIQNLR